MRLDAALQDERGLTHYAHLSLKHLVRVLRCGMLTQPGRALVGVAPTRGYAEFLFSYPNPDANGGGGAETSFVAILPARDEH